MSYSPTWQQVRAARAGRRAADPAVQDRRRQHEARAAQQAQRRVHVTALALAASDREPAA